MSGDGCSVEFNTSLSTLLTIQNILHVESDQLHAHARNASAPTEAPDGMRDPWPQYSQTVIKGRECIK